MTTDPPLKHISTQSRETLNMDAELARQALERRSNETEGAGNDVQSVDKPEDTAGSATDSATPSVWNASQPLRTQIDKTSQMALTYTREEPMKALLIAAVTGALVMGLISLMARADE